ncbi:hypothetical protein ACHQM5_025813 [Ranunculus cassubicifolius]
MPSSSWLSARRGGMTVLGKVTVPKPINLPSQRLENHGLDPSVEIVPKGTLNWGARATSSQNPWASPAQSPPNIGGIDSANHLNGRPSSSGSGTRPSTAGSDRSHEPVPNVWGPSSRPSSASGVLTSNQTSAATARPRSAEPRPASSQLSRFAEPISENSVTWGASGTMEKLGISSSKAKDFALSSGDFPTLGSEKTTELNERQGHSSQGRPVSGRASTPKQISETFHSDDGSLTASSERGAVSTHENNILEIEAGDQHVVEKWQRENNPYPTQNMPPQFGPWHGPPQGPPNGVWYRAPFAGPYGPPGPPGSYCPDPFAYYHTRHPSRPAGNMQPVVQPGSAPGGYYPDKGESHRPHMPDSYMQPVMPYGPGPYPVQMPYDGYYGPPRVGPGIPSEQRPPVMNIPTRGYNRYPVQNAHPDPATFHGSSGYGPSSTRAMEQGGSASGQPHGSHQGPYKVLLKHHDGWGENDSREKREHSVTTLDRDNLPGKPREIGQGMDLRHDEQGISTKVSSVAAPSQYGGSRGDHFPSERTNKVNRVEESLVRKSGTLSVPEDDTQRKRNPTLIEKIESLNQKARIRGLSPKSDDTPNEAPVTPIIDSNSAGVEALTFNRRDVSRPVHDPRISATNVLNSSSGVGLMQHDTQKRPHGVQGRTDDRGKGRSNHPKDDEWKKKLPVADFPAEGSEKPNLIQGKVGLGEDSSALDPNEHQRAKVREMVAERAKRLQKEEEERTREQRARAQAKLDELNRRTLAETPTEKVDNPLPQTVHPQHNNKQDNNLSSTIDQSVTDANTPIEVASSSASTREGGIVNPSSWDCYTVVPSGWDLDPIEDDPDHTVANKPIEVRDDSAILKSKQHGFKKKQNVKRGDADVNHFGVESNPTNATTDDSLLKHKKKNNRGKNKAKTDELSSSSVHPPDKPLPPPDEPIKIKKTSVSVFEVGSVQVPFSIEIAETAQDSVVATIDQGEGSRSPTEHVVDSSNHHHYHNLKPHPTPRRLPRNTQVGGGIRTSEKFHGSETSTVVWAPVGSGKKQPEDAKLNTSSTVEAHAHPGRGVHKSKRAEMERYVPKPKEVSVQQVNTEQTSGNQENNVLPVVENKHNNKHTGKAHGLWRPRNSGEAPPPTAANEPVTDTGVVGGYRSGRKPGLKGVVVSSEQETIEAASQWQPKSQSSQVAAAAAAPPTTQGTTTTTVRGNGGQQRANKKAPRKEYPQAELSDASHQEKVEEMFSGPRQSRYGGGQNQRVQQRKYDAQYQYHQKAGGRSNDNGNEPPSLPPNESSFDQGPPRGTGSRGQTQPRRGGNSYAIRGNNNINRDQ